MAHNMGWLTGLEPATTSATNWRSTNWTTVTIIIKFITILTYFSKKWSGRRGSNSRHSAWKADALPTELLPHNMIVVPRAGIEPARDKFPQDFKSCASTDFATKAYLKSYFVYLWQLSQYNINLFICQHFFYWLSTFFYFTLPLKYLISIQNFT